MVAKADSSRLRLWTRIQCKLHYPVGDEEDLPPISPSAVPKEPDEATLTLLYEGAQSQLKALDQQASALDSKANTVLASGSLLTVVAIALQTAAVHNSKSPWLPAVHTVAIAAVSLYVGLVYFALRAYTLRSYEVVPNPPQRKGGILLS